MPLLNRVLQHLELITQAALLLGLVFFAWIEVRKPRTALRADRRARWQTNVTLYVLATVCMLLVFDPLSVQAIRLGGAGGWGGLAATPWPTWVKVLLGVLLIDLLQYALHVAAHHIPWWWRLHKIHHSDTAMDASTAIRHHPLETLVNAFLLVVLLATLGVPVYAILLYAALQQLHSLFCHANLRLPPALEPWLRRVLVTPDMHAVHHSVRMREGNSNFGMVFPWWDRVFRSYCAQPAQGLDGMRMGIAELDEQPQPGLLGLLGLPFGGSRPVQSTAKPQADAARRRRGKR
ncbi:MAG: sterol desaturase family protein [Pseudomonadota bacterium]